MKPGSFIRWFFTSANSTLNFSYPSWLEKRTRCMLRYMAMIYLRWVNRDPRRPRLYYAPHLAVVPVVPRVMMPGWRRRSCLGLRRVDWTSITQSGQRRRDDSHVIAPA